MSRLKLAKGLSLPPEAMLQRFAILGMSGAGKSNAAAVMAEQMFHAGIPWVVIDPKGDWWGLRSSKTGKSAGLDVPIFGGLHADIPLYEDGGKVMAEAVAGELTHAILDISEFDSKASMLRFLTPFAERLFRVNRRPLMVIAEEADEYVPQNTNSPAEAQSVGVWARIVKRGRTRGIFTTLVVQRNAELAKAVLNQSDTVIAMRATGKLDRDAVKGWIEYAGGAKEILESLAKLDDGNGWIASPQKLKITELVKFDRRHTFDSGATPTLDGSRETVKLASIDLGAIEGRMKETIERAKAEDPKELRKRVSELERQIAEAPTAEPEVIETPVAVLDDEVLGELRAIREDLDPLLKTLGEISHAAVEAYSTAAEQIDRAEQLVNTSSQTPPPTTSRRIPAAPARRTADSPRRAPAPQSEPAAGGGDGDLTGPQQRVLDSIAWWEEIGYSTPTKIQVGFIAGYRTGKKIGGTYGNILGQLRSVGLLDYPVNGSVALTAEGHAQAAPAGIEKTTAGLQAAVMERLDGPERRVLQAIIDRYDDYASKQEIGAAAGYTVGEKVGGTFGNILGRLRSLGLIDYPTPGQVIALSVLFLEGS